MIAVAVEPDLTGRLARCCDEAPVRPSSTNLAFFEFRGEGSREATETCGVCRMHRCVHDPDYHLTLPDGLIGRWRITGVYADGTPNLEKSHVP